MDLELLKTFRILFETGNYIVAGDKLGMEHSTITRHIQRLEDTLGLKLVNSSPRGIQFTHEGQILYHDTTPILTMLEETEAKVRTAYNTLAGPLNVLATTTAAQWLSLHFEEFKQRYPEIDLHLATDDWGDIFKPSTIPGMTVALVVGTPPKKSPFIWEKIGALRFSYYAHPNYLAQHGTPQTLEDLDHHKLVRYRWSSKYRDLCTIKSNPLLYAGRDDDNPRQHSVSADDILVCLGLVNSGAGIGFLPTLLAEKLNLISVLEHEDGLKDNLNRIIQLVYPQCLKNNVRVKALKKFISEKSREKGFFQQD